MAKGDLQGDAAQSVGIEESQVWQELDAYFKVETIQPGDVTKAELMARYGINEHAAFDRMKALCAAHPDKWRMLKVAGRNGERWVLRQIGDK